MTCQHVSRREAEVLRLRQSRWPTAIAGLSVVLVVCASGAVLAIAGCSVGTRRSGSEQARRQSSPPTETSLGGLADSPWPRGGHDNGNTSLSSLKGPDRAVVRWKRSYPSPPVLLGKAGVMYVLADDSRRLVALRRDGKKLWQYGYGRQRTVLWAPMLARDGTVYVSTEGGSLVALRSGGAQQWEFRATAMLTGLPVVAGNGMVFCPARDRLIAVAPNGKTRWVFVARNRDEWRRAIKYRGRYTVRAAAAAAADGTLYLAVDGPRLHAVSPAGKELWSVGSSAFFGARTKLGDMIRRGAGLWHEGMSPSDVYLFPPMTGRDGTAYVVAVATGGTESRLLAIDRCGRIRWSVDNDATMVSLALGPDATVYAADDGGYLMALDPSDGSKKWGTRFGPQAWVLAGPSVDASGTVYVGCESTGKHPGRLYAFDSSGKLKWRLKLDVEPAGEIVIGPNRTLYVSVSRWVGPGPGDTKEYLLAIGQE